MTQRHRKMFHIISLLLQKAKDWRRRQLPAESLRSWHSSTPGKTHSLPVGSCSMTIGFGTVYPEHQEETFMKLNRVILLTALLGSQVITRAIGGTTDSAGHSFSIGDNDFLLDGQRFQIRCGEIHAPRVPREYWRHRLPMARAMGLNTLCASL